MSPACARRSTNRSPTPLIHTVRNAGYMLRAEPGVTRDAREPPPAPARRRRPARLLRSAGVRFAAIYAVLLALSASALALFLWWETAGLLDRQTEAAIRPTPRACRNAGWRAGCQRWC